MGWNFKYLVFWCFIWAFATYICVTIDGSYLDTQSDIVANLTMYSVANTQEGNFLMTYVQMSGGFFAVIPKILLFKYSFLESNEGQLLRWFLICVFAPSFLFCLYTLIFMRRG